MIDNIALRSAITAVKELPAEIALQQYHNPFTISTLLHYTLKEKSEVSAELYSIDGKKISTLIQGSQEAGTQTYHVDTQHLQKGIYICRFKVNDTEKTLKWIKQ